MEHLSEPPDGLFGVLLAGWRLIGLQHNQARDFIVVGAPAP